MRLPEFDAHQLILGEPYSWAHVVSVMLYPDDVRARQAGEHAFAGWEIRRVLTALLEVGINEPVDAALALWMAETPLPRHLVPRRSYRAALIAGATLNFIRRAAEHAPELASVGSFLRGLARHLGKTKTPSNSIRTMKGAWARYRSVAHLWASAGYLSAHSDYRHLVSFLAVAEEVRRWGETYVPPHGREPVLDPATTWKVPPSLWLPRMVYEVPPPRPETLAMVTSGKKSN